MRTVWKYTIPVGDTDFQISMPVGATIRHVGDQDSLGWIAIWVELESETYLESRTFRVVRTGHPLPNVSPVTYLGTVVTRADFSDFVWHLYEIGHPR